MRERIEATPGPLRGPLRHLVLGALAARGGQDRGGDRDSARARPRLRQRGRGLAADHRASATTRIGCWSAPTASRPTSPRTSPTTATSWSAGAERLIDPVGADHHGYVPRMRAAIEALGHDPDRYEAPIMQLVHLVEGGERARMSKRKGEFVTLDELIDDIGVDAARFFMLQRSHDTTLDLDLELARRQSQDNPVYYVQYAHARIASILRKAVAEGSAPGWRPTTGRPTRRRWPQAAEADGALAAAGRAGRAGARPAAAGASRPRRRRPPSAALRTASAPTRRRPPPTSTPSIATARSSGRPTALEEARLAHLRGGEARDRPHPRSARRQRARADVAAPATGSTPGLTPGVAVRFRRRSCTPRGGHH